MAENRRFLIFGEKALAFQRPSLYIRGIGGFTCFLEAGYVMIESISEVLSRKFSVMRQRIAEAGGFLS